MAGLNLAPGISNNVLFHQLYGMIGMIPAVSETMKDINSSQLVTIPEEVDVSVKARKVTVKGARGTLEKEFRHLAVDIYMVDKQTLKVEKWFGKKKELAAVRTVCSHINNMIKGVTMVSRFLLILSVLLYLVFYKVCFV